MRRKLDQAVRFGGAIMTLRIRSFLMALSLLVINGGSASAESVFERQSDVGAELKLPVHKWSDPAKDVRAVILAIPGLVFTGTAYDSMAKHLNEKGFVVYSVDLRGYGDWRESTQLDGDDLVHYSQSKEDITKVLKALRAKYPDKRLFAMGESFGAAYCVWEASTVPDLIDGVIAAGLSYKIVINPSARWVLTFYQGLTHPKKPLNLKPYLEPILSENKEDMRSRLEDPDAATELSATDLIKAAVTTKWAIRDLANIPRKMPILLMAGENDRVQKTNRLPEMVEEMGSKHVQLRVLEGKGHLLLEQRQIDPGVINLVDNWLDDQAPESAISSAASPVPTTSNPVE
jgi:alpha-beta hydrolase superfamily lysophospholipase